jgi:hypothetical protein
MAFDDYISSNEDKDHYHSPEKQFGRVLRRKFEERGYKILEDNTHGRSGTDLVVKDDQILALEIKGHYDRDPKQQVYTALGQVLYGMPHDNINNDAGNWGIAFPRQIKDETPYVNRIEKKLSQELLADLSIVVVFADKDGMDIHLPGEIGADDMGE